MEENNPKMEENNPKICNLPLDLFEI